LARRRQLNFEGVAEPVAIGGTARAILHKTVDDGVADLDMAKAIRLDLIEPDPDQPRKHFDEEALRELAQSIRTQGVLQPITVEWVPQRERFRIISGERRWRASRIVAEEQPAGEGAPRGRAEPARIPAVIRNPGAVDRYVQQLYENEHRQDYSDVERAFAYERLKEMLGLTWDELARKLGLSKGRIHQIRWTKNRLAPSVQRDITDGRLTGKHGMYLAPLPEPVQEAVAEAVKRDSLTHQQTQRLVQRVRTRLPEEPAEAEQIEATQAGEVARTAAVASPAQGSGPSASSTEHADASATPKAGEGAGAGPEGITGYTSAASVAALVDEAATEARAARPELPRGRRGEVDRALARVRELMQLEIAPPSDEAERARLAQALDELIAWATALRGRMEPGTV
jgi:ParB family chromosome partitioning protein